jgi:hypothetical protein
MPDLRSSLLFPLGFALALGCSGAIGDGETLGGPPGPDPVPTTDSGPGGIRDAATSEVGDDGTIAVGPGTSTPFDPKGEGSSGVKLDPGGSVVLDPTDMTGGSQPLIWVANSQAGTISKIDTRTMKELARYRTGPGSPDPSRTTIALNGDAVVVNRGGASATKIATNPIDCKGPGGGTSTGPSDVRAWGDDKCVMWNTPFAAGSLGRAAAFDAEKGIDGELSTNVWVGLWTSNKMVQLDSKTGAINATVDVSPIKPYGAAIDKDHHVWVWGGGVGYIDAVTKVFTKIANPPCAYGIAVDSKGRVWTSGGGCVARYTPAAGKWESVSVGSSNRGLAVDGKGSVWVADTSFGVHQIGEDSLAVIKNIPLGGGLNVVGMAIDFDTMVWAIDMNGSKANKIDPKTYAVNSVNVDKGPYTYSDMTGYQLRNAAAPFGKYRQTFKGCGDGTNWKTLSFDAKVGPMTTITVRVRTGKDLTELGGAAWVIAAKLPPDVAPVDLAKVLGDLAKKNYLQVEFELDSSSAATTPILSSISVNSYCPPSVK